MGTRLCFVLVVVAGLLACGLAHSAADELPAPPAAQDEAQRALAGLKAKGGIIFQLGDPLSLVPTNGGGGELLRRVLAEVLAPGPLAVRLTLRPDAVEAEVVALSQRAQPAAKPAPAILAQVPAGADWYAAGQWESFAVVARVLRRAMTGLDKDIADEFDQELAEVRGDLGFDFEKDFLANIGQEWAVAGLSPQMRGTALFFSAKDAAAFQRQAARLAEVGKQPWEPAGTTPGKAFRTSAYTIPLFVSVSREFVCLTNAETFLNEWQTRGVKAPPAKSDLFAAPAAEGEAVALVCFLRPGRLLPLVADERGAEPLHAWLRRLPADAAVWARVDAGKGYFRARLLATGVAGETMRPLLLGLPAAPR